MDYKITYVACLTTGKKPMQEQFAFISEKEERVVIGSCKEDDKEALL